MNRLVIKRIQEFEDAGTKLAEFRAAHQKTLDELDRLTQEWSAAESALKAAMAEGTPEDSGDRLEFMRGYSAKRSESRLVNNETLLRIVPDFFKQCAGRMVTVGSGGQRREVPLVTVRADGLEELVVAQELPSKVMSAVSTKYGNPTCTVQKPKWGR